MPKASKLSEIGGGSGISRTVPNLRVSKNVNVIGAKPKVGTSRVPVRPGKLTEGAAQARTQNMTTANSKPGAANARGLKAANKPTSKSPSKLSKAIAKKMYPKGVPSAKKK